MPLPTRPIGLSRLPVPYPGLGAMGLSAYYSAHLTSPAQKLALLRAAFTAGCTHWDTANVYGDAEGTGENERLVGRAMRELGIRREELFIATKFGIVFEDNALRARGSPAFVRASLLQSLADLQTPYVDLYYQHRVDPDTPVEETMRALEALRAEGKIRFVGLSECSAETIRRASTVGRVDAVQVEYSLFETQIETNGVLAACKELGIALIAYSPLGRGFLSGKFRSRADLPASDLRLHLPRFSEENFAKNLVLLEQIEGLARKKGCTPGQLALAWLHAQWEGVMAIPGTTRVEALRENLESVKVQLTEEELKEIRKVLDSFTPAGDRYHSDLMALEDK